MRQSDSNLHMKIIGVTGGAGSGKSTVSRILAGLGAKVIDADHIARQILFKGERAYREVVDLFGSEILRDNGEVDREKLGGIVFNDREKLHILNNITHKYIIERIKGEIEKNRRDSSCHMTVVDAPLPVKCGFLDIVDAVWVVVADEKSRIGRVAVRDGCSKERAAAIIKAQMSQEDYLKIADEVIENNGDLNALENKVKSLYHKYKDRF